MIPVNIWVVWLFKSPLQLVQLVRCKCCPETKFVAFCIFDAWQLPGQWSSTFLLLLSSPPPPWSSPVPPMLLLVGLLLRLPVHPPLPPIPLTLALLTTIPSTVTCNILDYVMLTLAWFGLAWISSNLLLFYTIVCALHWYPAKDYNCTYDAIYFFIINSILGNATQLTQVHVHWT